MPDFIPLFPRTFPPAAGRSLGDDGCFSPARLTLGWHMLNDFAAPLPAIAPRGLR